MIDLMQDLRFAARSALRRGRLSALIVTILALGIGASTALFSLADVFILRPPPFAEPERLVRLWENHPGRDIQRFSVSGDDYADWRRSAEAFEEMAAIRSISVSLSGLGEPTRLRANFVTPSFFDVFRIAPATGRAFGDEEANADGRVAILSHDLRRRLFGADQTALGAVLRLDAEPYVVIGVMPPGFRFPADGDVWAPLELRLNQGGRDDRNFDVYARLAGGVDIARARAEMDVIAAALARDFPEQNSGWGVFVESFTDWLVPPRVRTALGLLLVAVLMVLAVACANVAGLLLADAERRRREFTVRAALGAGRGRLARTALLESLLLAAVGGAVGALVASWAIHAIPARLSRTLPLLDHVEPDWRMLGFCALASVAGAVVFGAAPAARASRPDLQRDLRRSGRSLSAGRGEVRTLSVFAAAQIGLSCALLIGAALALLALNRLLDAPLGFATENVVVFETAPPPARYPRQADWTRFYRRLLDELRAAKLVEAAAATSDIPLGGGGTSINFGAIGPSALAPGETLQVDWRIVSPGYFDALEIPLTSGRDFREGDDSGAEVPVAVSAGAARRLWGDLEPVGRGLTLGSDRVFRVIGVVGDVRDDDPSAAADPTVYIPYFYWRWVSAHTVIRHRGTPEAALRLARSVVARLDPEIPVFNAQTMNRVVGRSVGGSSVAAGLMAGFAAVAALLTMLGIRGLLAFGVERRWNEFGVRLALGAAPRDIVARVARRTAVLLLAGLAAGMPAGWALSRGLRGDLFFETSPSEPIVYLIVPALLTLVAAAGAFAPALKAARIDPAAALRRD